MLSRSKTLKGYKIQARDGEIGRVLDFYFDDKHWTVRYLVLDTGRWLQGRQVLISPYALLGVNRETKTLSIDLTKKQIEDSPSLDSDKPVSRQFESAYYGYFGWPEYWGGPYGWGYYPYIERNPDLWKTSVPAENNWDPHLRSTREVTAYHIEATDGHIGHVSDFLIDSEAWAIRYLIVDTHSWLPGKKVLISPLWVTRVSWDEFKVYVDLTRDSIKGSPKYVNESLLSRDFEKGLFGHYDRDGYWVDRKAA
jgi:hypothetical protein